MKLLKVLTVSLLLAVLVVIGMTCVAAFFLATVWVDATFGPGAAACLWVGVILFLLAWTIVDANEADRDDLDPERNGL